jgi:O-antigen ligase
MSELAGMPTQDLPRFYIWAFAAERIAERPLLGWGMNASRSMPGGKDQIVDNIRGKNYGEVMPLHPHNIALQVWLELGVVGALLMAGLFARLILFGTVPARPPYVAAAAAGLTVTAFVQFALSYGAWQSWWLACVFLATAFLAIAARRGALG